MGKGQKHGKRGPYRGAPSWFEFDFGDRSLFLFHGYLPVVLACLGQSLC
jgi:hypothetical protein